MTTHKGSDSSMPWDRIEKYGNYSGYAAENIAFGNNKGPAYIYSLYIDDGSITRHHRQLIIHPELTMTGMAYCSHSIYGHILVIKYAGGFSPKG